jgi:NADH-quinone oxidoreductase subunit J
MHPALFGTMAALLVASALSVILQRSPIRSALSLVITLFLLAVVFLFLDAQLIAALQIIVYAGAVMVLFLFVIMLLNLQEDRPSMAKVTVRAGRLIASLFVRLVQFVVGGTGSAATHAMNSAVVADFGATDAVASLLFTFPAGIQVAVSCCWSPLSVRWCWPSGSSYEPGIGRAISGSGRRAVTIGAVGVLLRRSIIVMFMSIE